jgi:hypothetical protein
MKKIKYDCRDKAIFESGFKTFDNQTNYIGTGNVIANTQLSFYIRSFNKTDNGNGIKCKEGELQEYDLKPFISRGLHGYMLEVVRKNSKEQPVILYEFGHYSKASYIIDGYVLTDANYNHIYTLYLGATSKSALAVNEAKKYICNDCNIID